MENHTVTTHTSSQEMEDIVRAGNSEINVNLSEDTTKDMHMKTITAANDSEEAAKTGAENTGPGRRVYRLVAVCFGLLCVAQLIVSVSLHLFFSNSALIHWLQTSYNNLTEETDQLRTLFNVTLEERNQLQTSFHVVTKERDQLQASFNAVTKEKDQLQTSFNAVTKEKDQLQTSFNAVTKEKDQLQTSFNAVTNERDQLIKSIDQLQTSFNAVTKEKDQLQTSFNAVTNERDQLIKSIDQMKANYDTMRDQFQLCMTGMLTQGWRFFGSSWYYISTETKSWEESRKDCKGRGADLVIINSKEEQEFIHGFQKKRYWIGLSDIEKESTMTWVDGTPLTIKFWMIGEPNNMHGTEDCIELMHPATFNDPLHSWNDETCSNSFFWICETVARL